MVNHIVKLGVHDLKKRFYVFQLCSYYPAGGMNDIVFFCDTNEEYEEYEAFISKQDSSEIWYEILDTSTGNYFLFEN